MSRQACGWVCVLVVCLGAAAWAEEAAQAPVDVAALQKQVSAWRKQQTQLWEELRKIETKMKQSPEGVELRKARAEATRAVRAAEKADAAVAAARRTEEEAGAALKKLIAEKFGASTDAAAVHKERLELGEKWRDLGYQIALARLKLDHRDSPVNRKLKKDPELAKLKKAARDADLAWRRKKLERKERDKAWAEHMKARRAKLAEMGDAKTLLDEIAEAEKTITEFRSILGKTDRRLREIRTAIERGKDADVNAAREKLDAARKATRTALAGDQFKAVRKAETDAQIALGKRVRALVEADEAGARLIKERDELNKQVREAQNKIRAARRKKPRQPKKPKEAK